MKKALQLFILPLLAGTIITIALHTFIPIQARLNTDMLTNDQANVIFGLFGFFFGFLPCFIRGLAVSTLEALKPVECESIAPVQVLEVGQVFVTNNGAFRIKSVKSFGSISQSIY